MCIGYSNVVTEHKQHTKILNAENNAKPIVNGDGEEDKKITEYRQTVVDADGNNIVWMGVEMADGDGGTGDEK